MALSSVEFHKMLVTFEDDLVEVREGLYKALTKVLSADKREELIAAGRRKLAEFDGLLARLDPAQREQAVADFGDEIEKIRERLTRLAENHP